MAVLQIFSLPTPSSQTRLASVTAFLQQQRLKFAHTLLSAPPQPKWLKTITTPSLLIEEQGGLCLIANGMKVTPNWASLQQRVVKAGKKSELLLKIAKPQPTMQVIDATAGFGHDSLILASTGASILMVEENPVMYLLLQAELAQMQPHPNWHKLLARLTLKFGKFQDMAAPSLVDLVFLDPMFPENSYKSAQVSKHMQVLYGLAAPPSFFDEQALLSQALACLQPNGKVIVKRPKQAPYLANIAPAESVSNAVVRFDSYTR